MMSPGADVPTRREANDPGDAGWAVPLIASFGLAMAMLIAFVLNWMVASVAAIAVLIAAAIVAARTGSRLTAGRAWIMAAGPLVVAAGWWISAGVSALAN